LSRGAKWGWKTGGVFGAATGFFVNERPAALCLKCAGNSFGVSSHQTIRLPPWPAPARNTGKPLPAKIAIAAVRIQTVVRRDIAEQYAMNSGAVLLEH
jgi:hypothetical protein